MSAQPVVHQLAQFVANASWDRLSPDSRDELKIRVLDSLGCALGALDAEPVRLVRAQVDDFGGRAWCTLIGGGRTAPDRAALYNGALVRYLDFNDSYLAEGETCHPSDNLAPVLTAAEYAQASGKEFLTALAVAYQVQCRLSELAPVRARGFDHTTQGAFATAAGVAKALGLPVDRTANAIAIAGTAFTALRVTRTGVLSHWKGLAAPNAAFGATHAAFLAMRGVTGPMAVFEGNKGFMESVSGKFENDWSREGLELVRETILKKYNAEIHSQSAIEAMLDLRSEHDLAADDVERIELEVFDVAFHIIGGGEEGGKTVVRTKEEADHSLPYLIAVALLDGTVMPEQFAPARVIAEDVQALLRRVSVRPADDLSAWFPDEHACRLRLRLRDGRTLMNEKRDYEGFRTRPMSWERVTVKFEALSHGKLIPPLAGRLAAAVKGLDELQVSDLCWLLEQAGLSGDAAGRRRPLVSEGGARV